jgi:hypothetical protein
MNKFRPFEMGADLVNGRHFLRPSCRVGLAPSIHRHIAECSVILYADPHWQAAVRETLQRAWATRKASGQLRDASEMAHFESEVLVAKMRKAAEAARRAGGRQLQMTYKGHRVEAISYQLVDSGRWGAEGARPVTLRRQPNDDAADGVRTPARYISS